MANVALKPLINRLSAYCQSSLTGAAQACIARGNYEISPEHLLLTLLETPNHDVQTILKHYEIESGTVLAKLHQQLLHANRSHAEKPVYSRLLLDWIQDAWMIGSVEFDQSEIRSGILMLSLLTNEAWLHQVGLEPELSSISVDDLRKNLPSILANTAEVSAKTAGTSTDSESNTALGEGQAASKFSGPASQSTLEKYTQNFTEQARQGKIDPIFCRDAEIRQMIDILGRRRKNNPLIVGEAGVGKTALVEGLALKIVQDDVPESMRAVELLGLDLQAMQAGASVRGEFEQRLKSVIDEVKGSETPVVLFIDEVHTLIGAGGNAGTGDAANILKPALARGELRSIAATTWSEYKKYIDKDAALERRFQLVKLNEPTPEEACIILRGLRHIYEQAHGVLVRDDAIEAAARLSARYLSGRRLPDKAVDVLDTVCSRVKLSVDAIPAELERLNNEIKIHQRELTALNRDYDLGIFHDPQKIQEIEQRIDQVETKKVVVENKKLIVEEQWNQENTLVKQILALRREIVSNPEDEAEQAASKEAEKEAKKAELEPLIQALKKIQTDQALIHFEASPELVAQVISDWTGIPLGNMVRNEAQSVLTFGEDLSQRIKGQAAAIQMLDRGVRAAKTGLNNPNAPLGVFLLVGPSGVGKTEAAIAMADLLFGGERFLTTLNMSEFMDRHSSSKLIGSAPGLVGYGEGGALTEAVRQKPYSVVLLDEVEKADAEIMNLFYQVFDKGQLADGESRLVDFRNTLILMTSNLASAEIMSALNSPSLDNVNPETGSEEAFEAMVKKIRPILNKHFKPALVARMTIVPFMPLRPDVIESIVQLKMNQLVRRIQQAQKIDLSFAPEVISEIASRCTEVETGARNIDHIINNQLLPRIATAILERLDEEQGPSSLFIGWDKGFRLSFQ